MSALTPEDFDDDDEEFPVPGCSCEDCEDERDFAVWAAGMPRNNIEGGIQL